MSRSVSCSNPRLTWWFAGCFCRNMGRCSRTLGRGISTGRCFDDLAVRQLHAHQIEHTRQLKLDDLMGFESLLFDEPHLIREVLIWICGWIPVFEVGSVEKTRQRHLADDAATHQIVVCLNFSGDSSGKVGDLDFGRGKVP